MTRIWPAVLSLGLLLTACNEKLDERGFRRKAEAAFSEVHPGWTIYKRTPEKTLYARGDQQDELPVGVMFAEYNKAQKGGSNYLDKWIEAEKAKVAARRRTLAQAAEEVIPIIKSGKWVEVQDLGAIGPKRVQDKIRPWRKKVATDVYVVLGVPEEKLGYRLASIHELKEDPKGADFWLDKALGNLVKKVGPVKGNEVSAADGHMLAFDLANVDGISALILHPPFRNKMLEKFGEPELGAAVPIRNVLIIFDPNHFAALKPVRARAHQLYDTQNHPGFRGLLRFDKESLSLLEAANPKKKRRR